MLEVGLINGACAVLWIGVLSSLVTFFSYLYLCFDDDCKEPARFKWPTFMMIVVCFLLFLYFAVVVSTIVSRIG